MQLLTCVTRLSTSLFKNSKYNYSAVCIGAAHSLHQHALPHTPSRPVALDGEYWAKASM
ncbi:MAG: hypothetical protein HOP20_02055 [Sulfuriferula sp.]|nr:hypothetical protein [Sulfuriferula sp.]